VSLQDWLSIQREKGLTEEQYKYVENKTDFDNVDAAQIQYLLGESQERCSENEGHCTL
jgi:hypothetical protein